MTPRCFSRRLALLLPVLLASCGTPEEPLSNFPPLRYAYLPPIGLNVATLEIRQQFFPSGALPDVTAQDPAPPIAALKAMAQDRVKAYGTSGRAIFNILNASLTQRGDAIDGSMLVSLMIVGEDNREQGVARAQVNRHYSGSVNGLHRTLYDFTKAMMDDMNIEFEYQVRHNLKSFLVEPAAPEAPVEQTPLDGRQVPPLTPPQGTPPAPALSGQGGAQDPASPQPLSPPPGPGLAPDPFAVPPSDPYGCPSPVR